MAIPTSSTPDSIMHRAGAPAVAADRARPVEADDEQQGDQHDVGDAQRHHRIGDQHERHGGRQRGGGHQDEHGNGAAEVVARQEAAAAVAVHDHAPQATIELLAVFILAIGAEARLERLADDGQSGGIAVRRTDGLHDPGVAGALEDGAHDVEGGVDDAPGDVAAQRRDEAASATNSRSMPAITLAPSVQVSTMISPNRISARLSAGSR